MPDPSPSWTAAADPKIVFATIASVALPFVLAVHVSPTSTFVNQWWAFWGMSGLLVIASLSGWTSGSRVGRTGVGLVAVLSLLALLQVWTHAPLGQRWVPFSALMLSAALAWAVARTVRGGEEGAEPSTSGAARVGAPLMVALLVAALVSALIGAIQVFSPGWADGSWIAVPTTPGRALGNLRQPNQLATLLLWGCGAVVWLGGVRRWSFGLVAVLFHALVLGVVLTASRTGMVGVVLMALWGVVDRRQPGRYRLLLVSGVLAYALGWWGLEQWSAHSGAAFYGDDQVRKTLHGDPSSSRGKVWRDTLTLIGQHPWTGVGPGAYNFVWSMTAFPGRAIAFFDHSHSLPLQLAVESGIPAAALVLGGLGWVAWRAARAWFVQSDPVARTARILSFMLASVGVHSLLEYPLWYAYFLLPAAALAGWLTALVPERDVARADAAPGPGPVSASVSASAERRDPAPTLVACVGAVCLVGCVWAAVQYHWVATIFEPDLSFGAPAPLPERIRRGQTSVLFGHHADYAQVTMSAHPERHAREFERPLYHLLDTRIMIAYAKALAAEGDEARAHHVAARLREFNNPASAEFFEPCRADPADTAFPCGPDPALPAQALRPEAALPPSTGDDGARRPEGERGR